MNRPSLLGRFLLIFIAIFSFVTAGWGQSGFFQEETFNFESDRLSGFSEDGRVKVLLLTLLPSGMTETAAGEIAKALQLNLFNTNHFTVVGPSEWNAQIKDQDPTLADCHDIACGVLIGKLFQADKVLVGTIEAETMLNEKNEEEQGFTLTLRMVDVATIITDYNDVVQFTDLKMHDELFQLSARISQNTLLRGYVLAVKATSITIDLGRAHGLKIGHRVVLFRPVSTTTSIDGEPLELSSENVGLAEIVRVSDMSSDAVVVQKTLPVVTGDQIKTFIDATKQIRLVTQTRKELDTQKRLRPKTKPLQLVPTLVQEDTGQTQWSRRMLNAKTQEETWMYTTAGAGAATLFFLGASSQLSGIMTVAPWVAGGVTVYAGMQYLHFRNIVTEITTEGRTKDFLSTAQPVQEGLSWTPIQNGMSFSWTHKF